MPLKIRPVLAGLVLMVPVIAAAQQFLTPSSGPPVDPDARFEVASVKPAVDAGAALMRYLPNRFEVTNLPISLLVRQAVLKPDYQIVGMPGWVDTERYTIQAKAAEGTPIGAMTVMIQNLLKDRFQLAMHTETRELPVSNLVTARADGRLGPDLTPTSAGCLAEIEKQAAALQEALKSGTPSRFPTYDPNGPAPCGMTSVRPGRISSSGRTMANLVQMLSDLLARPVIDNTGLPGKYDFALRYAAEGRTVGPFGSAPGAPPPPADPDAPSLSVAVQEQLGLKLENGRGPVEIVVIDRIEKPTLD